VLAAAVPGGEHRRSFDVSVSGDVLMHTPLIDRARANAGGHGYDFAPFFE